MIRLGIAVLWCIAMTGVAAAETRIKDITTVRGLRANQLVGYGLVAGLKGTGDSLRSAPFTDQSLTSMLERMGVNIRGLGARTRNIAAVLVTAELPALANPGNRIDVTVTSLGDAASLAGGTLVMTPLQGGDNAVYAVAQGSVTVSGFEAKGQNETITSGVPTTGRIAGGAMVERASPGGQQAPRVLHLELANPDFATAIAVVDAVNAYTQQTYKSRLARDNGPRSVAVDIPERTSPSRFLAEIGRLEVQPDMPARIVVDERTGTIVISRNVKVSRVAVTHGNLVVRVTETPSVSQPAPFSKGETVVTKETTVTAGQEKGNFALLDGVDLQTLVTGLNRGPQTAGDHRHPPSHQVGWRAPGRARRAMSGVDGKTRGGHAAIRIAIRLSLVAISSTLTTNAATSGEPARAKPAASSAAGAVHKPTPLAEQTAIGDLADRYCEAVFDAAAEARHAFQVARIDALNRQLDERVARLEARSAELKDWIAAREAFMARASEHLVGVIAAMRAEAASALLARLDAPTAAAVLSRLEPRAASAILAGLPPDKASRLTTILGAVARKSDAGATP